MTLLVLFIGIIITADNCDSIVLTVLLLLFLVLVLPIIDIGGVVLCIIDSIGIGNLLFIYLFIIGEVLLLVKKY